jgi:hypothetical protein
MTKRLTHATELTLICYTFNEFLLCSSVVTVIVPMKLKL